MESAPDNWAATRYSRVLLRHWLRHGMDQLIEEALKRRSLLNEKDGSSGDCDRDGAPQLDM
jgi:hypothetical protein